jgi:hypothetical protein
MRLAVNFQASTFEKPITFEQRVSFGAVRTNKGRVLNRILGFDSWL